MNAIQSLPQDIQRAIHELVGKLNNEGCQFSLVLKHPARTHCDFLTSFPYDEATHRLYSTFLEALSMHTHQVPTRFHHSINGQNEFISSSSFESPSRPNSPPHWNSIRLNLRCSGDVNDYLYACFNKLQQIPCKRIGKQFIKHLEPSKQTRYPYRDGNDSKPPWWPEDIPHIEPDHLRKDKRIKLLVNIVLLCTLTKSPTRVRATVSGLKDSIRGLRGPEKDDLGAAKWEIIKEMFSVVQGIVNGFQSTDVTNFATALTQKKSDDGEDGTQSEHINTCMNIVHTMGLLERSIDRGIDLGDSLQGTEANTDKLLAGFTNFNV